MVLSYAHAGDRRIQEMLAAGADLACTSGTGIMLQCAGAAEASQRAEDQEGPTPPWLGVSRSAAGIRAQVMAIVAAAGKSRWCGLATASADAAQAFLRVFPDATFVCVHRCCQEFIRTGARADPWLLQRQELAPYLLCYRGNTVAALAAYWARSAEKLVVFERTNPGSARRVRYEDLTDCRDARVGDAARALGALRTWLGLGSSASGTAHRERTELLEAAGPQFSSAEPAVPADLIPQPLRERVTVLHAELGYPAW